MFNKKPQNSFIFLTVFGNVCVVLLFYIVTQLCKVELAGYAVASSSGSLPGKSACCQHLSKRAGCSLQSVVTLMSLIGDTPQQDCLFYVLTFITRNLIDRWYFFTSHAVAMQIYFKTT